MSVLEVTNAEFQRKPNLNHTLDQFVEMIQTKDFARNTFLMKLGISITIRRISQC